MEPPLINFVEYLPPPRPRLLNTLKSNVPNRLQTGCHTGWEGEGWLGGAIGVISETIALQKANHFFSFFGYPSFPASLCMRNLMKGEGHTECTMKILTRTHALPPPIKRFSSDDSDRNENAYSTLFRNFFVFPARTLCDISLSQKL